MLCEHRISLSEFSALQYFSMYLLTEQLQLCLKLIIANFGVLATFAKTVKLSVLYSCAQLTLLATNRSWFPSTNNCLRIALDNYKNYRRHNINKRRPCSCWLCGNFTPCVPHAAVWTHVLIEFVANWRQLLYCRSSRQSVCYICALSQSPALAEVQWNACLSLKVCCLTLSYATLSVGQLRCGCCTMRLCNIDCTWFDCVCVCAFVAVWWSSECALHAHYVSANILSCCNIEAFSSCRELPIFCHNYFSVSKYSPLIHGLFALLSMEFMVLQVFGKTH